MKHGDELKNQIKSNGKNLLGQIYPAPFPIVKAAAIFLDGRYISHKVDRILHDKEKIDSDLNPIQVIATPGHTTGHTSYYLPKSYTLISGDLIDPRFRNQPILNNANANFEEEWKSLQKLDQFLIKNLCPAHGCCIYPEKNQPNTLISQAKFHLESCFQKIFEYMQTQTSKNKSSFKFEHLTKLVDTSIWPPFYNKTMAFAILQYMEKQNLCQYLPQSKSFLLTEIGLEKSWSELLNKLSTDN